MDGGYAETVAVPKTQTRVGITEPGPERFCEESLAPPLVLVGDEEWENAILERVRRRDPDAEAEFFRAFESRLFVAGYYSGGSNGRAARVYADLKRAHRVAEEVFWDVARRPRLRDRFWQTASKEIKEALAKEIDGKTHDSAKGKTKVRAELRRRAAPRPDTVPLRAAAPVTSLKPAEPDTGQPRPEKRPRGRRGPTRCSKCHQVGHNARSCDRLRRLEAEAEEARSRRLAVRTVHADPEPVESTQESGGMLGSGKKRGPYRCGECGEIGHTSKTCDADKVVYARRDTKTRYGLYDRDGKWLAGTSENLDALAAAAKFMGYARIVVNLSDP